MSTALFVESILLYGKVFGVETLTEKTGDGLLTETVLYQGEGAMKAHAGLFRLDSSCYRETGTSVTDAVLAAACSGVLRLHIVGDWETILKVALWSAGRPTVHDTLALIAKAGAAPEELAPFRKAEVSDLFPWLYYGKRFDILRRICNFAKTRAAAKCGRNNLLIYCHLFLDDAAQIIASNL